jgi:hypothetical protein
MVDSYRIRATIKVVANPDKLPENDIIRSESKDTDLTLAELPGLTDNKVEDIVAYANNLTESLKSCLLIHASKSFEEVNVISKSVSESKIPLYDADRMHIESILKNIRLSKTSIVYNTVYNVAVVLDNHARLLNDTTFFGILEIRDNYLDKIASLIDESNKKLIQVNDLENDKEKRWEQLKILSDFSFKAKMELSNFKDNILKEEIEILNKGIIELIASTGNSVKDLPVHIRLKFDKNDFMGLSTVNLMRRINRALKIGWTNISGKKISVTINLHTAANYYLYYRRLK